MKIFIVCSKAFYNRIPYYQDKLISLGHEIILPNCYENPETESLYRNTDKHATWKAQMIKQSEQKIKNIDAILTLNFDKNGVDNYIGGATFLEIYDAFRLGKKIFFVNDIPDGILKDELIGFSPIIIKDNFELIK